MNHFEQELHAELLNNQFLLHHCQEILRTAPPGRLFIRQRKHSNTCYQIVKEKAPAGWRNVSRNLKAEPETILALSEKKLAEKMSGICGRNLSILERAVQHYHAPDRDLLTSALPEKYQDILLLRQKQQISQAAQSSYQKAPFDSEKHIHETRSGVLVHSKSEVIIANALSGYGIPFHYEERFPYPNDNGDFYYPDFTIPLPDGERLLWEHLGLLSDLSYCIHNAQKLHTYQQHGFLIGRNLILTQDDNRGNCGSGFIYRIIERDILPWFEQAVSANKSQKN